MSNQSKRRQNALPTERDALDAAVGGMSCTTALAVAKTYDLASAVLHTFGNTVGAVALSSQAPGVTEGGCG